MLLITFGVLDTIGMTRRDRRGVQLLPLRRRPSDTPTVRGPAPVIGAAAALRRQVLPSVMLLTILVLPMTVCFQPRWSCQRRNAATVDRRPWSQPYHLVGGQLGAVQRTCRQTVTLANHTEGEPSMISPRIDDRTGGATAAESNGAGHERRLTTEGALWAATLWQLLRLTRPSSTPGILAFFLVGARIGSRGTATISGAGGYCSFLATQPALWATFAALVLVSAGSMVINDIEDARLGRDALDEPTAVNGDRGGEMSNPYLTTKPLVNHSLSLAVARRFLLTLYAATALVATQVPGLWTRTAIALGMLLTHAYTQYLKPLTWVKNVTCALVIAMAPVTSGLAAGELLLRTPALMAGVKIGIQPVKASLYAFLAHNPDLLRVFAVIFFGVMSRELMMDCNDVLADRRARVRTVPVAFGRGFASRVALLWSGAMSACVLVGPLAEVAAAAGSSAPFTGLWRAITPATYRRLSLAVTTSAMFLRRSWQVFRTRGEDMQVVDVAVNEALLTVLVGLASFM